jgi:hypothetical protein
MRTRFAFTPLLAFVLSLLCPLLLPACAAAAADAPKPVALKLDPDRYLATDQIKPGMKGYGLTVFRGVQPEKFDVEVLGVMRNVWDVGRDIVLIRCSGKNLEFTGIAAGMSGSPIYIDDKLVGALAYGFQFSKAPIAGVTPIGEMLPLLQARAAKAAQARVSRELPDPLVLLGTEYRSVAVSARPLKKAADATIELAPLAVPVRVSGLGPPATARRFLRGLARYFDERNLAPVLGGGVAEADVKDAKIVPGASVTARFLWGDLNWDGLGTVTEVVDGGVLAFGHPMQNDGAIDIPMATGYVHTFMPSLARTFKMGAGGRTVGSFRLDGATGIAGRLGEKSESVAVRVEIVGPGDKQRIYNFHALRHPSITPFVVSSAVGGALLRPGDPPEELTSRYTIIVRPERREPITIADVQSGWDGWTAVARIFSEVNHLTRSLIQNKFERIYPVSVDVRVTLEAKRTYADIDAVALDSTRLRRGEDARVTVEMLRPNAERVRRALRFRVPRDAPLGPATLQICGANACLAAERKEAPARFDPKNIEQALDLLAKQFRRDRIYARLVFRGRGIAVGGKELPELPPSVFGLLATPRQTGLSAVRSTHVTEFPSDLVVDGSHVLRVLVEEAK